MKQVVYWVTLSISARISEVTVLFLGVWEQINNPDFNSLEFEVIRSEARLTLLNPTAHGNAVLVRTPLA